MSLQGLSWSSLNVTGRGSWRLEESRFHPYTQEGQERNIGLSTHLIPWEENSIRIQKKSGNHFQTDEWQGDLE